MTAAVFSDIFERRIAQSRQVLLVKSMEYADPSDVLHNFHAAADLEGTTPPEALRGMLIKHWQSLRDISKKHAEGKIIPRAVIDEKIGDAINYLILLEATLLEMPFVKD